MDNDKSSAAERARSIRGGGKQLEQWARGLDPHDPQTGRTAVLTTYQSWQKRVWMSKAEFKKGKRAPADPEEEGEDEGEEDEDDETVEDGMLVMDPNLFEARISDEAHRMKSKGAKQTGAFFALGTDRINFPPIMTILLTATALRNCVGDFAGLLRFPYAHFWHDPEVSQRQEPNVKSYMSMEATLREKYNGDILKVPPEELSGFYRFLDPDVFKAHNRAGAEASVGVNCLPLVMMMTTLRRVKGTKLRMCGQEIRIGEELPPYTTTTVEILPSALETNHRQGILTQIAEDGHVPLAAFTEDEPIYTKAGNFKRRRFIWSALGVLLDLFLTRKVNSNAADIHKL
jgi:hypothetical protein